MDLVEAHCLVLFSTISGSCQVAYIKKPRSVSRLTDLEMEKQLARSAFFASFGMGLIIDFDEMIEAELCIALCSTEALMSQ